MRDRWLAQAPSRRPWTWERQQRAFRALGVPADIYAALQPLVASPDDLEPVFRLVRDLKLSNAVHRAHGKHATWAAGAARDPHYQQTPVAPGALRPILELVEGVITNLERLIQWRFNPAMELHELDANLKPTGRSVRLSRLDEATRAEFETARNALMGIRSRLRDSTQRHRGRKATLVQPFRVAVLTTLTAPATPARRRELEQRLRDELLRLHPDRQTRPRAARLDVGRLARRIGDAVLPPPPRPRARR
jgi:BMFP domain-containing protein YqiC